MKPMLLRLRRIRRRVLLHRRGIAVLLAALAVLLGLEAASADPSPTVGVWTAARPLDSGTLLRASDFRRTAYATGSVPEGVVRDLGAVVGRSLATPLGTGEPLTRGRVVAPGMLAGHPGQVAVPVRVSDPSVVRLLHVGDRVDLVAVAPDRGTASTGAAPTGAARTVATGAEVLALPSDRGRTAGATLPGRLVVFATSPDAADTLTAAGVSDFVTIRWNS